MHRNRFAFLIIIGLFLSATTSCLPPPKKPPQEEVSISSLLILPVDPVVSVKADIKTEQMKELRQGALVMDELLASFLREYNLSNFTILDEPQFESYIGERTGSRLSLGLMIAKEMGKDALLILRLNRFAERRGTNYSVISPASLAFDYKLIDARSGVILCSGIFDASQEALFDNLFSFSGRKSFRWLPIREFAADSLQEKLDSCPALWTLPPR